LPRSNAQRRTRCRGQDRRRSRAVDALVVPGGESTTVIRLLDRFGLGGADRRPRRAGMPFWGTCMGMIVAAHDVAGLEQRRST
jgi:5'-phosphate synthase pdxT subunit